ncbi:SWIM zinc finger family protein [Roseibacillus persicicus]|uniref:SWIM zinc finger family protein n=1 Tax=Roseibacillus persicicus TaxID=454148 RepID=UPI00398B2E1D
MLTTDQVTALAPDAASFKAGRGLASPSKWSELGSNEVALWGLAKGSGKKPYQTQVVLGEFATKCSCPSRKFPCKHALGLLFLAADQSDQIITGDAPDWVTEWLESRQERAEKAEARAAKKKTAKPKDEAAAAKRAEKRQARVEDGIELLEHFLADLMRNGLAQDHVTTPATWEDLAKRLVDCQATGLAGWVRRLGDLPHSGAEWESLLLHELSSLHLLLQSYRKKDSLSPARHADILQLVGQTLDKEEVLKASGIHDHWFVATREVTENDRLLTSATWLYGLNTRTWLLTLNFGMSPSRPVETWPLGTVVETEMVPYPGTLPERALPRLQTAAAKEAPLPPAPDTLSQLLQRVADTLATNPCRTRFPFFMLAQPGRLDNRPVLVDQNGDALPWKPRDREMDLLRVISAGQPIALAGEWNGHHLLVHSAADGAGWFSLSTTLS